MANIYFEDKGVPKEQNEFVLWIDLMGTRNRMCTSVRTSTIFICKLHVAILQNKTEGMHIYPMMDGAYITTKNADEMEKFIGSVFNDLSDSFIGEKENLHKFLVKGALAYGPIVHGANVQNTCSGVFKKDEQYLNSVLFGVPMIQSNSGEKMAPPFGVYCDESVRMANGKFSYVWYKWIRNNTKKANLLKALKEYFDYAAKHTYELEYGPEKINEHRDKCEQYFGES